MASLESVLAKLGTFLKVTGDSDVKDVTLTLDTVQYAANDLLAATQVITDAMRVAGGHGLLVSLVVLDEDYQKQPFDLMVLRSNVSMGAENAVWDPSDANMRECLGILEIAAADYVDCKNSAMVTLRNLNLEVEAAAGSKDLYFAAVTRGTPTHTASGIKLKAGFERN